ncbi:efflux RND transporter periplasmic adaptor subunit [Pseudodesulfovibrio alkaliphilus]|uniref:efflux RND transporter periplasmic adaptor subunit n=1 Tax=Pseudodesulfovibrio alkaliphilus TaxID=2661613 RepID=UPI0018C89416
MRVLFALFALLVPLTAQAGSAELEAVPVQLHGVGAMTTPGSDGQRAQIVAIRQAVISSELAGRITALHFREGERFKKGDILVSYDSALFRARLDRAVQAEAAALKRLNVAQELRDLDSISVADYEQAKSDLSVARAETSAERVMVNRCQIAAPFSGRVGETYVRASEHVAEGTKLFSIYDDSAFEVEAIVPSRWLAWIKPGHPMTIAVDETGASHQARVLRMAGVVDPVSQSVKIVALIEGPRNEQGGMPLMPGMSGTVFVVPPQPVQSETIR